MLTTLPITLAWVPGPWELVLILGLFLLLFGSKKLPDLARSMGSSVTQFKRGLRDGTDELREAETKEEERA